MSLHEWLKYNNFDFETIKKIETSYYNNTYHLDLTDEEYIILADWLTDPERSVPYYY